MQMTFRMPTSRRLQWAAKPAVVAATLLAASATSVNARPVAAAEPKSVTQTFRAFDADSTAKVDHAAWTKLLSTYVKPGGDGINYVEYADFKRDGHATLKSYVARLQTVDPRRLNRSAQFAYWANLYNAKTLDVVLNAYPVKSIKDISIGGGLFGFLKSSVGAGGPWKAKIMTVAGMSLSLDDIEHNILRPVFKDPRVHYAVNCASIGCPNLPTEAFTSDQLQDQLNANARAYVNHPRAFSVDADGTVTASSIYNWFKSDFGGTATGVLAHAAPFADAAKQKKLRAAQTINAYVYDWSLNDVRK